MKYFGCWNNYQDMIAAWGNMVNKPIPTDEEVLFASYGAKDYEEDVIRARAAAVADFGSDMTFMIDCGLGAMEEILEVIEKKHPLIDCRQQFVNHLLEQCARLDKRFSRLAK